jgi:hypothetical protein
MKKGLKIKIISTYSVSFILIVIAAYNFVQNRSLSNILFFVAFLNIVIASVLLYAYLKKFAKNNVNT